MSWLQEHLNGFVREHLGMVPKVPQDHERFFSPREMSLIKNMWRTIKRDSVGKPLLLAGRDVFIFEVLARRENFPTTFRPDISRLTVDHVKEDYSSYFLFDTGFVGSIPRGLKANQYTMASASAIISNRELLTRDVHQVFPRLKGARSLALKIERTPKYWKRGFSREGEIFQEFSEPEEFLKAVYLTIEVYTDSSPRFADPKSYSPIVNTLLDW